MSGRILGLVALVFIVATGTGYAQDDSGGGDAGSGGSTGFGFSDADLCPDCGTVQWDYSAWGSGIDWSQSQADALAAGFTPGEIMIAGPSLTDQLASIATGAQQALNTFLDAANNVVQTITAPLVPSQGIQWHDPPDDGSGELEAIDKILTAGKVGLKLLEKDGLGAATELAGFVPPLINFLDPTSFACEDPGCPGWVPPSGMLIDPPSSNLPVCQSCPPYQEPGSNTGGILLNTPLNPFLGSASGPSSPSVPPYQEPGSRSGGIPLDVPLSPFQYVSPSTTTAVSPTQDSTASGLIALSQALQKFQPQPNSLPPQAATPATQTSSGGSGLCVNPNFNVLNPQGVSAASGGGLPPGALVSGNAPGSSYTPGLIPCAQVGGPQATPQSATRATPVSAPPVQSPVTPSAGSSGSNNAQAIQAFNAAMAACSNAAMAAGVTAASPAFAQVLANDQACVNRAQAQYQAATKAVQPSAQGTQSAAKAAAVKTPSSGGVPGGGAVPQAAKASASPSPLRVLSAASIPSGTSTLNAGTVQPAASTAAAIRAAPGPPAPGVVPGAARAEVRFTAPRMLAAAPLVRTSPAAPVTPTAVTAAPLVSLPVTTTATRATEPAAPVFVQPPSTTSMTPLRAAPALGNTSTPLPLSLLQSPRVEPVPVTPTPTSTAVSTLPAHTFERPAAPSTSHVYAPTPLPTFQPIQPPKPAPVVIHRPPVVVRGKSR